MLAARVPPGGRMVGHVRVVAILMIIQGVFELLMGLGVIGMAFLMPGLMRAQMAQQETPPGGPSPETMGWIVTGVYVGFGLLVFCTAVLHIFAGVRNYGFRNRVLGIVALITGMMTTLFTCYCAPTAVALGIYGLICYLNSDVNRAFAQAGSGGTD